MNIKDKIIQACCKNPKYESCGFVIYDNDGFNIVECENKAENKQEAVSYTHLTLPTPPYV